MTMLFLVQMTRGKHGTAIASSKYVTVYYTINSRPYKAGILPIRRK